RYGKVRLVNAFNYTDFMYRPRRPEELDSERGGGVVYSQAAHQIDVVRRIVRQPVESVRAVAANWDASRPSEGAYSALMTFASGAAA
ncbi:Gfo/Idh/MocA family oxidoreductase, partial [Acinetobacter pittii]